MTRNVFLLLAAVAAVVPMELSAQSVLGASASNVAVVGAVTPGGLAASAGIKPGDVILDVDGRAVHSVQELVGVLRSLQPAKRVLITVRRGEAKMLLTAYPKVPESAPTFQPAAATTAGPPPGDYGCTERWLKGTAISGEWQTALRGGFTLMPGGSYRYLQGGEVGRYSYDPATHKLRFQGGYFGNTEAVGEYTSRGTGSQIDIVFPTKSRWMCGNSN